LRNYCQGDIQPLRLGDIGKIVIIGSNGVNFNSLTDKGIGCIHYTELSHYYDYFTNFTKSFVSEKIANSIKKVQNGDLIISSTSKGPNKIGKAIAWLGEEDIVTSGHSIILKHKQNPKYLSYWFDSNIFSNQISLCTKGTRIYDISVKKFSQIKINLPPRTVQDEIVNILDDFIELKMLLKSEVNLRNEQFNYYRKHIFQFDKTIHFKTLESICHNIYTGGTPSTNNTNFFNGTIDWLRSGEINYNDIIKTELKITPLAFKAKS
jgi:type I restriction enzyme S subunit